MLSFDSIPHDRLMALVAGSISDGRVLALIEGFLKQDIMKDMERWQPTVGTPQGGVISPLLANLYLHPLDLLMDQSGRRMVRYADDFVILCRTEAEAQAALRDVAAWVAENGLTLHPDKTRVGDCRQVGQGFEFLGYRFQASRRLVRKKSLMALKDKVRGRTGRSRGVSLGRITDDLNPMLRGWFGYFQHAAPRVFRAIDGFIRRRLRAVLRKQARQPGFGRCKADHLRWPNAFFAERGLFTLETAHVQARRSRRGNQRLESRVRENRTHRSEGGEGDLPDPYRYARDTAHARRCCLHGGPAGGPASGAGDTVPGMPSVYFLLLLVNPRGNTFAGGFMHITKVLAALAASATLLAPLPGLAQGSGLHDFDAAKQEAANYSLGVRIAALLHNFDEPSSFEPRSSAVFHEYNGAGTSYFYVNHVYVCRVDIGLKYVFPDYHAEGIENIECCTQEAPFICKTYEKQ
jgi:hypothetical protein